MWNLFLKYNIILKENAYYFIAQEIVQHHYKQRKMPNA